MSLDSEQFHTPEDKLYNNCLVKYHDDDTDVSSDSSYYSAKNTPPTMPKTGRLKYPKYSFAESSKSAAYDDQFFNSLMLIGPKRHVHKKSVAIPKSKNRRALVEINSVKTRPKRSATHSIPKCKPVKVSVFLDEKLVSVDSSVESDENVLESQLNRTSLKPNQGTNIDRNKTKNKESNCELNNADKSQSAEQVVPVKSLTLTNMMEVLREFLNGVEGLLLGSNISVDRDKVLEQLAIIKSCIENNVPHVRDVSTKMTPQSVEKYSRRKSLKSNEPKSPQADAITKSGLSPRKSANPERNEELKMNSTPPGTSDSATLHNTNRRGQQVTSLASPNRPKVNFRDNKNQLTKSSRRKTVNHDNVQNEDNLLPGEQAHSLKIKTKNTGGTSARRSTRFHTPPTKPRTDDGSFIFESAKALKRQLGFVKEIPAAERKQESPQTDAITKSVLSPRKSAKHPKENERKKSEGECHQSDVSRSRELPTPDKPTPVKNARLITSRSPIKTPQYSGKEAGDNKSHKLDDSGDEGDQSDASELSTPIKNASQIKQPSAIKIALSSDMKMNSTPPGTSDSAALQSTNRRSKQITSSTPLNRPKVINTNDKKIELRKSSRRKTVNHDNVHNEDELLDGQQRTHALRTGSKSAGHTSAKQSTRFRKPPTKPRTDDGSFILESAKALNRELGIVKVIPAAVSNQQERLQTTKSALSPRKSANCPKENAREESGDGCDQSNVSRSSELSTPDKSIPVKNGRLITPRSPIKTPQYSDMKMNSTPRSTSDVAALQRTNRRSQRLTKSTSPNRLKLINTNDKKIDLKKSSRRKTVNYDNVHHEDKLPHSQRTHILRAGSKSAEHTSARRSTRFHKSPPEPRMENGSFIFESAKVLKRQLGFVKVIPTGKFNSLMAETQKSGARHFGKGPSTSAVAIKSRGKKRRLEYATNSPKRAKRDTIVSSRESPRKRQLYDPASWLDSWDYRE